MARVRGGGERFVIEREVDRGTCVIPVRTWRPGSGEEGSPRVAGALALVGLGVRGGSDLDLLLEVVYELGWGATRASGRSRFFDVPAGHDRRAT